MFDNVFAYTAPGSQYPGYVSINRDQNGDITVTVREAARVREGVYVCGFAADKGKPGRCTPGDQFCNNYCNMAPLKGAMQDSPLRCTHVDEGKQATFTVPAEHWTMANKAAVE